MPFVVVYDAVALYPNAQRGGTARRIAPCRAQALVLGEIPPGQEPRPDHRGWSPAPGRTRPDS